MVGHLDLASVACGHTSMGKQWFLVRTTCHQISNGGHLGRVATTCGKIWKGEIWDCYNNLWPGLKGLCLYLSNESKTFFGTHSSLIIGSDPAKSVFTRALAIHNFSELLLQLSSCNLPSKQIWIAITRRNWFLLESLMGARPFTVTFQWHYKYGNVNQWRLSELFLALFNSTEYSPGF